MKVKIIVMHGNGISERGYNACRRSARKANGPAFWMNIFKAIRPWEIEDLQQKYGLSYTYPTKEPRIDLSSGLSLSPYVGSTDTRIACFFSHYLLWKECVDTQEHFLILEHDAEFVNLSNFEHLENSKYQIIGINDPRGATRRSQEYHNLVQASNYAIAPPPYIDDIHVPQGLAGNSAYYIKPLGAQKLIELVDQHGIWPNDAIMCKQLLPGLLGQIKNYYTKVQGLVSTTTT
jgi:GR25 family glycosyltransferase involved in LPS biosynthesis|tara:strand:- start:6795 stop:7493 length:699 start_codon:yes stop_codon:yes gene_type:complete